MTNEEINRLKEDIKALKGERDRAASAVATWKEAGKLLPPKGPAEDTAERQEVENQTKYWEALEAKADTELSEKQKELQSLEPDRAESMRQKENAAKKGPGGGPRP